MRPLSLASFVFFLTVSLAACGGGGDGVIRGGAAASPSSERDSAFAERLSHQGARIQLIANEKSITLQTTHPMTITHGDGTRKFSPRAWTLILESGVPPRELLVAALEEGRTHGS